MTDSEKPEAPTYENRIMNLPCEVPTGRAYEAGPSRTCFKMGHRDARHAAAEIACEADSRLAAVGAENARLQEALAFYADPETYHAIAVLPDPPCGEFAYDVSDVDHEFYENSYGARARAAITDTATATKAEVLSTEYAWGDEGQACDAGDVTIPMSTLERWRTAMADWDAGGQQAHDEMLDFIHGATPASPTVEAAEIKRLLIAYMDHVGACEGTDFLDDHPMDPDLSLSDADRAALRALSQQEGGESGGD